MDQLGRHMAQSRITLRLDQQILAPVKLLIHRLKLDDLALPFVVQITLFNGEAGLAGKQLQSADMIILNGAPGHIIVSNDYSEGTTRRVQRHHDKGILIKDVDELPGHGKRSGNHLHILPVLVKQAVSVAMPATIAVASLQRHGHPTVFRRNPVAPSPQHGANQDVFGVLGRNQQTPGNGVNRGVLGLTDLFEIVNDL